MASWPSASEKVYLQFMTIMIFSVMGYAEILFKLPTFYRRNKIYEIIKDFNPDVFL